ncbi:GNAT family N-acetyltransferase [Nibricoccus aquaticus]|nr:GNAT family N-acetyltransferase [Nibricoccus aquaticus]
MAYVRKGVTFVGEENGVAVAVAVVEREEGEFELRNIAVAEKEQGRGLGREMLRCALMYAAGGGAKRITVGTGNSSLRALAFYQRNGFRITGVIRGFFDAYEPPIVENGIACRDMIRLTFEIGA